MFIGLGKSKKKLVVALLLTAFFVSAVCISYNTSLNRVDAADADDATADTAATDTTTNITTTDTAGDSSSTDAAAESTANETAADSSASSTKVNSETLTDMRGVWVAYCDYANMGLYNKSESVFRKNADAMFKKFKNDKINTVFFHVVPCNDSIYPSKYLKWSKYMFSKKPSYDPLEILIETAHSYDISFHAWLNPYRKKMGVSYNPGKASSTNRIVKIVKELVNNYDLDGIHFDDYFYPDNKQFKKVSMKTRKKNINKMVAKVYKTIKSIDEDVLFGISPAGNASYAESIGCDLDAWMNEDGYVDYIVPQIYWSDNYKINGKKTTLFSNRLNQWIEMNESGKPMMIGLALYRAGKKDSHDKGWKKSNNIIVTQIKKEKAAGCQGFVLFSSTYMYSKSAKKEMKNYRKYYGIK